MDPILFSIFFATLLAALLPLFKRYKKYSALQAIVNKIPGPKAYPVVGTSLPYIMTPREDRFALTTKYTKMFDGIYRMWHGYKFPEVRISQCDYAEEILKSSKHIEKSPTYRLLEPWLGDGLISSTGQHWFTHRRLLTPAFHFTVLESFCDVFADNTSIMIKELTKSSADGKALNIYPFITKAALDIICETAMGIKVHAQQQSENNEYVESISSFSEIAMQRFYKPWLFSDFLFKRSQYFEEYERSLNTIQNLARKVIKERKHTRQTMKENNEISTNVEKDVGIKKRQAFLDLLLDVNENENQVLLSDDEVRDEVNTFMFAGHDTTSVGICWALFLIGLHEEVQEKIFEEMTEIFGDDAERVATYRDLNEMKYLERVLKESLRIYPSVPNISRKMNEDLEIGGYKIPRDSFVALQIYFIHRDERFFKDPEVFDPDRFLPENTEGRHAYAFVPFAAGPRNCIGQRFAVLEEKSVISAIIRNFKIKSVQKREEVKMLQEVVLRPLNGIHLKLERRQ